MNRRNFRFKKRLEAKKDLAHHRLEHLYEISKQLATFENVEESFPKIVSLAAATFPLSSAVLIEKRGDIPKTTIWPTTGLNETQIKSAITHARSSYSFLAGMTPIQSSELRDSATTRASLQGEKYVDQPKGQTSHKFLVLPVVLEAGDVFGVLQLETTDHVNESDLAFVDALTNLIAVALDRYYYAKDKQALQLIETSNRTTELQAHQKRVTNLEEEKILREKFVSVLTHDLRTPLTSIKLSAQLILRKPGNVENCHMMAVRIISSITRLDQMIGDLLDANRIRAGEKLRLEMSYCNLSTLAFDTVEFLKNIHGDRFELDQVKPEVWGYWNKDGLRRVIENLVNNAVKYGSQNYKIQITLKQSEHSAQLWVHNEGNPIDRNDQQELFQQFKRTGSAVTSKKKGWGLGLSLVKGMVETHGGKISIESTPELGTTFKVELPNDSRPLQEIPAESESA